MLLNCIDCSRSIEMPHYKKSRCEDCRIKRRILVRRLYIAKNLDKIRERARRRRATEEYKQKEDKRREDNRAWREKNKEALAARRREAYFKNKDVHDERNRRNARRLPSRFRYSVKNAAKRGKAWDLTFEQYVDLIAKPCFYCGGVLGETAMGLDRVDRKFDYIISNVAPCCKRCNFRKGNIESAGFDYPRTVELMKELVEKWNAVSISSAAALS